MLSKSSARLFFIGGTVVFSFAFLALTWDTVSQVPRRSNEDQMTEAVRRGHTLWNDNNCMGCHTLLGEGAYYAPELTKVVERRGEEWIRVFLKDPQAMFPGRRKMVQYDFTPEEINDLIAFFDWIGRIDANGFPPKPDLADKIQATSGSSASATTNLAMRPMPQKMKSLCISCHQIGGSGGVVGPALDNLAQKYNAGELDAWLSDPQSVKPGTSMPKLPLTAEEREAIVQYLLSDNSGGTP